MIRPGRLWWFLRRDLKRGFRAAYHHYVTLPKIVRWRPGGDLAAAGPVAVHVLTRGEDWLLAGWMLASWFVATGRKWEVIVHDDGTLPAGAGSALSSMFPAVTMIGKTEAEERMAPYLAGFPLIRAYRERHALARKLFDAAIVAGGSHYLALDSDILFFSRPEALLRAVDGPGRHCWFNRDVAEGSLVSSDEAGSILGVRLWERVNSGLALVWPGAIEFDFCERVLRETGILSGHPWRIEQTLYALCASRNGEGGLLGPEYEISLGSDAAPGSVCRHYVGAVRDRFYAEGIARLRRRLL
jgi:hypothetical protein